MVSKLWRCLNSTIFRLGNNANNFSLLWPTFRKIIGAVGNNAENIHELKLEQIFALLPAVMENYWRYR
jgi:hypothetical protein